ncbi:MAG: DAK2 domain-containing protein [Treponema sp.]|nr:DAK2 domain-containing protein [Treponema sp.]
MASNVLDGKDLIKFITAGAANLREHAQIVNDLNVFPIPDGDTGENMSLTIEGGIGAFGGAGEGAIGDSIGEASSKIASGMLMNARGNSGVILSQLFAGIADRLKDKKTASVIDLADALKMGVDRAYKAVVNPTEGTILTVARETSDFVYSRVNDESSGSSLMDDTLKEMRDSLDRTPELLSVLKEAGVVDSGGAGLYYIVEGIYRTLRGEGTTGEAYTAAPTQKKLDFGKFTEFDVMKYGYCTEFLLRLQTSKIELSSFKIDKLISFLTTVGDSIVAFQNGTIVKVHVHTMTPGMVLDYCQKYGEFLTIKIENMTLEHNESTVTNNFMAHGEIVKAEKQAKRKKYATIAVANGGGIQKTFRDLGADFVIDGGQTKNPSSEDFIRAFDTVNADTIFVLPNNSNIILAARQAAELYEKSDVRVIDSKTIGDGYAALTMLSYDSADSEKIVQNFTEAMEGVQTGEVSIAVRDAKIGGMEIHCGDYIGFCGKSMLSCDRERIETARKLADSLKAGEHEFMIVIYGKSVGTEEREDFHTSITKSYPKLELYEIDGGQDIYDYLLILQ